MTQADRRRAALKAAQAERMRRVEERAKQQALAMNPLSPRARLFFLRHHNGLSQTQFADKLGMRWDTYRRFEIPLGTSYSSTPNLRMAITIRNVSSELGDEIDPEDWVDEQDDWKRSKL